MARRYIVKKSDTWGKIARASYGDAALAERLAAYNGLTAPIPPRVNQAIELPNRRELVTPAESSETAAATAPVQLTPPHGLQEILETFGNIFDFIRGDGSLDPRWEAEQLDRARLPFPVPLSWKPAQSVARLLCHKKLVPIFPQVFETLEQRGLREKIKTYGGCFNFRSKRTSGKLSTHSWGIAIDLNPDSNPQGSAGDMDSGVVKVFQEFGFTWGGDWSGKSRDPMHFQFCKGY